MKEAFAVFDRDGDHTVSVSEISKVMKALGEDLSEETLQMMLASVDLDNSGAIDFDGHFLMLSCYVTD